MYKQKIVTKTQNHV